MKDQNVLSNLIQSKREELGLTQQEVADHLDVSRQTISKWENGYIKHMDIGKVPQYSTLLELPAIAFIYPDTYLDSKYIDHDYIEIARKLESNNISIENIKQYIKLISDIKLNLFKDLR